MGLKFSSLLFSGVSQLFNKVKIFFQEWEGRGSLQPPQALLTWSCNQENHIHGLPACQVHRTLIWIPNTSQHILWRGRECAVRGSVATERDPSEIRRASICLDTATTCKGKLQLATCIQCVRSTRLSVDRKGIRLDQAFWLPSWG